MPPVRHQNISRHTRETSGIRNLQEKAKDRRRQRLEYFMRGLPINQPGPSKDEINVVTPSQDDQRVQGIGGLGSASGLLQPICIWSGTLAWILERKPKFNVTKLPCDVFRYVSAKSKDIETELKVDTWPGLLLMELIPRQLLREAGGLKGSKSVMFCIQQSIALKYLSPHIGGNYVGLVKFVTKPSAPKCDIKVLVLWYMPGRKAYVGLIPKNQDTFMDRLRRVMRETSKQIISKQPAPYDDLMQRGMVMQSQQHAEGMMTGLSILRQSLSRMIQTRQRGDDDDDEDDDNDDDSDSDYYNYDDSDSDSDSDSD